MEITLTLGMKVFINKYGNARLTSRIKKLFSGHDRTMFSYMYGYNNSRFLYCLFPVQPGYV